MKFLATFAASIALLFAAQSVTLASDHGKYSASGNSSGYFYGGSRGGSGGSHSGNGGGHNYGGGHYGGGHYGGGNYYGGGRYYGGRGYGRGYGGYGGYYYGGYPFVWGAPYYGGDYNDGGYYSDDSNGPAASADNDADSIDAEVQQDLAKAGYYHGPIDGIVGPMTRSAIAAYQRDNDLRVTGTITHGLLDSLNGD